MKSKVIAISLVFLFLSCALNKASGYDFSPSSNPQTVSTNVSLSSGNNTFTIPNDYLSIFTGVISNQSSANPGTLVKVGDGILALNGANTYTGGTLLQAGTIRLGNNAALGVWPTSAASGNVGGLLTVSGTGTIQALEDRTLVNRFITADASSLLTFDIASGKTLTLQNVSNTGTAANSYGSVIATLALGAEPIFTGGGHLVIQENRSSFGGGISSVGSTGTVGFDLTELASAQFLNNSAFSGNGGAIYATATSTNLVSLDFGDHLVFSGNSATTTGTSGDGGAIFAYSNNGTTVRFGSDVTFSNNTANRYGGALYVFATQSGAKAELFLGTHTLFASNVSKAPAAAQAGGGAFYSTHNATVSGNTLFRNNAAISAGGAILMKGREAGTLLLDTSAGDIGFTGNFMNVTNIASPSTTGTVNSVYLDTLTTMQFKGTGNVFFNDPIASGNKAGNKMILGRTSASDPAANAFSGVVQFKGNSTVQNNFTVQVGEGTLRLASGAQLAGATAGSFTLGTNGTLAGSGTIGFGTNTISGTVAADSATFTMSDWSDATNSFAAGTGKTTVAATETIGSLTFTGNTVFDGATLLIDVDDDAGTNDKIFVTGAVTFGSSLNTIEISGNTKVVTYDIIDSDRAIADPGSLFQVTGLDNARHGTVRLKAGDDTVLQVVVDQNTLFNHILTWTGVESGTWNGADENWTNVPGGTATVTQFMDGDRVFFDTTNTVGPFIVNIPTPVTVADMTVSGGGDYTITGDITAQKTDTTLADATGKLVKSGAGTLTLDGMNDFTDGIDITGGTVVAQTADSVKGGTVKMSNGSTLQFDNDDNGTFASNITGAGNLLKSDSGTLTLIGSNDYDGATNITAGTLVGDIASGTDLTVSSGATYQSGNSDRTVASLNGSGTVIMQSQKLTVGSGDFSDGTITGVGTLTKTGTDTLSIGQTTGVNLNHTAGTLNIAEDRSVVLTGTATIADGTTLGIGVGDGENPSLTAQGLVTIGTGTTINITGYDQIVGIPMLLIHSDTEITGGEGAVTTYTVGGVVVTNTVTLQQFINGLIVEKLNDDKDLYITSGGLVWNNTGDPDAHGNFYVASGATATISELLENNTNTAALDEFNWDGETLTKTGDGTLTLSHANSYTGNTNINAGTLIATNVQSLGNGGQANISGGASLVLNYTSANAFGYELTGTGNLTTQNDVLINRDNSDFIGTTTIARGTLTLGNVNAVGRSAIANNSALVLDFTGVFGNPLTGVGSLTIASTRTIDVSGTSTFSGPTTIRDGATLNMKNASALGTSALSFADDTGILNLDFNGLFANALYGAGRLNVNGDVTINRGNMGFNGDTFITNGNSLTLNNFAAIGNTVTQTVTNDGSLVFDLPGGGTNTFAQKITGSGGLTKKGAGTLVLYDATNDYTGKTTVNAGVLVSNLADKAVAAPCGTELEIVAGATYRALDRRQYVSKLTGAGTVDMNSYDLDICSGDFSGGTITGGGTLTKTGTDTTLTVGNVSAVNLDHATGTLTIAPGKSVTLTGDADFADGTILNIGPNLAVDAAGTVTIGSGTTLNVIGYNTSMGTIVLIDAGAAIGNEFGTYLIDGSVQTQTVTIHQYINTSPLVQRDAEDLTRIVISSGGLVWNNTAPGTAHGTFEINGTATVDGDLNDNITAGPGFGWDGETLTKTGNGTLTLTGDNGYTGGTNITGGTVIGSNGNAFGTGTITTNGGTTVGFDITTGAAETAVNDVTGAGNFVKTGGGILIQTGSNSYTGGTTVSDGTLVSNLDYTPTDCGTPLNVAANATYRTYDSDAFISELTGAGDMNMNAYDNSGNKNLTVCSGDFSDGRLLNVATLTKTNASTSFTVGSATVGSLVLAEGTLIIDTTKKLSVTGATAIGDNTILSIAALPALETGSLTIGDNVILDICGCSAEGIVIVSQTEIVGDFADYYVGGVRIDDTMSIDKFINGLIVEREDASGNVTYPGTRIRVTNGGLVWNNLDPNSSHGTFNISTTFKITQQLTDRDELDGFQPFTDPATGQTWDGQTLTKKGEGTLTLANGGNSYSGGTDILAGKVVVEVAGSLGVGDVRNSGILEYKLSGDGTMANDHEGIGAFVKSGTGVLTVTGTNTYTGGTTVNAGTLISNLASPTATLPCGTALDVASGATYRPYNTDQYVSKLTGAGTVDMNSYDLYVCSGDFSGGLITGVGTLTKRNVDEMLTVGTVNAVMLEHSEGTLTIASGKSVTLSGDADFADGTILNIGPNLAVDAAGTVTIGSGTTLNVIGYNASMGTVVLIDAGSDILNDFGIYLLDGANQTSVVTLAKYRNESAIIQRNGNDLSQIIISGGGLVWNNTAPGTAHGTFQVDKDDTVTENLRDNTIGAAWAFGWDGTKLTKTGDANLTLTGDNSYTGGTEIRSGTITAKNENSLGTGTVDIETDGKLVVDYNGTLTNSVRGTGQMEIDGSLNILKSNGDFSGSVNVTTGTTTLQRADGLGTSTITLEDGTTLFFNTASTSSSRNTIYGTGNLVKGGAGTLTLENENHYTGSTTVQNGTLIADLTEADPATLPCGAALTVNAGATFQARSREQFISVLSGTGTVDMAGNDLTVCSGNFTGGTFENLNNVTKKSTGTLRTDGFDAVNFTLREGTFILNPDKTVTLTGTAEIGAGTILDIGARLAFDVAGKVTIDPTATLNVTGYAGSGEVVLIRSGEDIGDHFGTYTVNGAKIGEQVPSLDIYYIVDGIERVDNEILITGAHLAWDDMKAAHGTFLINSGTVTIADALNNVDDSTKWFVDDNGNPLWDGETLTKTGAGTLVLGNGNAYTGGTDIKGGSVVATGEHSVGSGTVRLANNDVSLVLDYTADGVFANEVVNGGTVRKIDGYTLTVTADLVGMTGVFRQDAGTVIFRPRDNDFAGSYDQRGGTFEGTDGLTIAGDASFEGTVRTNGLLNVAGTVEIGGAAVVDIAAELSLDVLGGIVIDDTATLNVDNYAGVGEVLLIRSATGITGNFGTYTINGQSVTEHQPTLDVYRVEGGIRKTSTEIRIVGDHLAWYDPGEKSAHGHFYLATGSDTVDTALIDNTATETWMTDADGTPLWDGKTLTKTGDGILTLTGENAYTGATIVSAGTLVGNIASGTDLSVAVNAVYRSNNVDRVIGLLNGEGTVDMQGRGFTVGGGDFCAGTLSAVGQFTKNTAAELEIGSFDATGFDLAEGVLSLCHNGRINVAGAATIGDDTIFNIGAVASLNTTEVVTIGVGATLNVTGYGGEGEVILIHSETEIVGDFDRYTVDGVAFDEQVASLERYYILDGIEKSETTIRITDGHLAWYDPNEKSAHGHFYIDHGSVTISKILNDNPDEGTWFVDGDDLLWDGKTLTKTGAGTLVLDAVNDYTGDTVITTGTVVATNENSLGRVQGGGSVQLGGGANLEIRYGDDGAFSKTVQGTGTIRKTDEFTTAVTSDLTGMTGVFVQTAGTVDWQTGRLGGTFMQESGRLNANGLMSIGGDAVFQGEIVPGAVLTVDGDVSLIGADLYVNLYLNENQPEAAADFISGREITIDGGTLHVNDKGVASDYLHGSVSFAVLKSTDGVTGEFETITGLTSIFRAKHGIVGDDYVIELSLKEIPFDPFGPNHNTEEVITTVNDGMDDPDLGPLVDDLINMDTDDDLMHAIDTLRGTEIVADGLTLALWAPWRPVFNRLYDEQRTKTACDPCDAACSPKKNARNVWFEGYYRNEDVSNDGNARPYDARRAGLTTGLDTQLSRRLTVGGMFGYGDVKLTSRFGRIETDDYTFGLYGKLKINRNWFSNAFVGYGRQEFDYRRQDFAGNYRAKYDGDAMYASLELVRPIRRGLVTWMPVAAVDFQKSWNDAFTERTVQPGKGYAQSVRKGDLSRTELRFGLNAKARWTDRIDLTGRIQYARQVGGNTRGTANCTFAMAPNSRTMDLWGVDLGRDRLNAGVGAKMLVGNRKQSSFFGDYDFDYGKNSRAHTGQIGFTTSW